MHIATLKTDPWNKVLTGRVKRCLQDGIAENQFHTHAMAGVKKNDEIIWPC